MKARFHSIGKTVMGKIRRIFSFVVSCLFLIIVVFVFSCGSPDIGSLTFHLVWLEPLDQSPVAIVQDKQNGRTISVNPQADYPGVSTIRASLWDGSEKVEESSFLYSLHTGEISATAGTYILRIEGLDSSDEVIYQGFIAPVTIVKGENTDVGEVAMVPTGEGIACSDECSPSGSRQCSGNGYQICGDYDSDDCLEWSAVTSCAPGETCSDGYCSSTCTDECSSGERECYGDGYRICGDYDSDSCLDWSPVTACGAGETCSGGYCVPAASTPLTPSNLQASAVSSSEIDLSWTDNSSNEGGFKIERKTGSGGTYSLVHTTVADVTSHSDTGLSAGTAYYYRIYSFNSAGDSGYSNEASATTQSVSVSCSSDEYIDMGSYLIAKYEASRPDASATSVGSDNSKACSRAGVLPWEDVSWNDAEAACEASGGRLCNANEWEDACDGVLGDGGSYYPYGDLFDGGICNGSNTLNYEAVPTGSMTECVSSFGVFDLSGNLWEWTSELFYSDRVYRGGDYDSYSMTLECWGDDSKSHDSPSSHRYGYGFRCCKDK